MAEDLSWLDAPDANIDGAIPDGQDPTFGEYGTILKAGGQEIAAGAAAGARYLAEGEGGDALTQATAATGEYLQKLLGSYAEDNIESISPETRQRLESTLTSEEFWNHPFSGLLLKLTRMSPSVIAAVVPGLAVSGAVAGTMVAGGVAGGLSAGTTVDEIYDLTDKMDDKTLRKEAPFYNGLREDMDETKARELYNEKLLGIKPHLLFVLGAATGVAGPAGQLVRAAKGGGASLVKKEGRGLAGRVGQSFTESGTAEAIQTGAEDASVQDAAMDAGQQKEYDVMRTINAALEGGVLGGVMGGVAGVPGGRKAKTPSAPERTGRSSDLPTAPDHGDDVGNPKSAPTRSDKKYPKPKPAPKKGVKTGGELSGLSSEVAIAMGVPEPTAQAAIDIQTPTAPTTPVSVSKPSDFLGYEPVPPMVQAAAQPAAPAPVAPQAPAPVAPQQVAPTPLPPEVTPPVAPPAPAPAPVTPKAAAMIAKPPKIDSKGRRVLQDQSEKAQVARDAQGAKQAENIEKLKPKVKAPPKPSHDPKAKIAKEKADAVTAKVLMEKHLPSKSEDNYGSTNRVKNKAARAAILTRAKAMLDEANELGVKVFKTLNTKKDKAGKSQTKDPQTVLLTQARTLVNKSRTSKGAMRKDYHNFKTSEIELRVGEVEGSLDTRKEEGSAAKAVGSAGNVDNLTASQEVEVRDTEATKRMDEGVTSEIAEAAAETIGEDLGARPSKGNKEIADVQSEGAASKGKSVGVTAADRAKYNTPAKKVTSKVTPKVEKVVAQSKKGKTSTTKITPAQLKIIKERKKAKDKTEPKGKADVKRIAADKAELAALVAEAELDAAVEARGEAGHVDVVAPKAPAKRGTKANPITRESAGLQPMKTKSSKGKSVKVTAADRAKYNTVPMITKPEARSLAGMKERLAYFEHRMQEDDKAGVAPGRRYARNAAKAATLKQKIKAMETGTLSDRMRKLAEGTPDQSLDGEGIIYTADATDILTDVDLATLAGFHDVAHKLLPFFRRRMMEMVKDTKIKFVTRDYMNNVVFKDADDIGELTRKGKSIAGAYNLETGEIHILSDQLGKPKELAHYVMHEIAHAATLRGMEANPSIMKSADMMMNEVAESVAEYPNLYENINYAFTDPVEFIAEAMSNPRLQEAMARVEASPELVSRLQLGKGRLSSLWDIFTAMVRRSMGMPKGTHSMVEAVLRVSEQAIAATNKNNAWHIKNRIGFDGYAEGSGLPARMAARMEADMDATAKVDEDIKQGGTPKMLKLYMFDRMADLAGKYFANDVVMKIHKTIERIRTTTHKIEREAEPIINKLYNAESQYKGVMIKHPVTGEQVSTWDMFTEGVHDETASNINAAIPVDEQKHLGKNRLDKRWAKAQWGDLNKTWRALPEDLQALRKESMDFFTNQQNEASLDLVKNILGTIDIHDDALAGRIHEGTTTEADIDLFEPGLLNHMNKAKQLSKIAGPYFPLMRRGEFVVNSKLKFKLPKSSTQVDENTFEFANKKNVEAYLDEVDLPPTVRSKWVDKNTGSEYFTDAEGDPVKVLKEDFDAEQRWEVTVENQYTEFVETESDANTLRDDLEARPDHEQIKSAPRKYQPDKQNNDLLSNHMQTFVSALKHQKNFKDAPKALQGTMISALNEVAVRSSGATRVQSRRLPRRNVAGFSKDLTRNTVDYSQSMAGYLSRLRNQTKLDEHVKDMQEQADTDYSKETSMGRGAIRNEVMRRLDKQNGFTAGGKYSPAVQRLLVGSFISKLASPAYSVINATQPMMTTFPILAGRHTVTKTVAVMSKVYSDIGAGRTIKEGIKATGRHATKPGALPTSFLEDVRARLTDPNEIALTHMLEDVGTMESDSGLELDRMVKATDGIWGKADKAIGYFEGMARQLPRAVETVNRAVAALSAYRLEIAKGADHETAMTYAHEVANATQFLYSNTNAPPVFNHPLGKLTFQFKKFGLGMYHLLGQQIGKALHGATREEKIEARKALATLVAMHVAMAGTMGLPTEPFKALLMGANLFGLTDKTWGDAEEVFREITAEVAGKEAGEVINRGLPRLLGLDMSSRIGLDNLLLFGEPRSNDPQDSKAYMFDMIGGAPTSLMANEIFPGTRALLDGDFRKAAEKLVPIKVVSDSIKAVNRASEGKKSKSGRQTMTPYSFTEAATRAIGFTPARDAENRESVSAFYNQKTANDEVRRGFMYEWIDASPGERGKLWGRIETWNRGLPRGAKLTRASLTRYVTQRGKEERGLRVGKRERHIKQNVDSIYNQ